jgi:hypothetical protein
MVITIQSGYKTDKAPILGLNKLKIGNVEYTITTDKTRLL